MNRRNLFQACAAGLAWLVGGKLPAASVPIETCTWHVTNSLANGRAIELVAYGVEFSIANGKWQKCDIYRRPDGLLVSNVYTVEPCSGPSHWQHPKFNEYLTESLRLF
jgi:hypothetical protein